MLLLTITAPLQPRWLGSMDTSEIVKSYRQTLSCRCSRSIDHAPRLQIYTLLTTAFQRHCASHVSIRIFWLSLIRRGRPPPRKSVSLAPSSARFLSRMVHVRWLQGVQSYRCLSPSSWPRPYHIWKACFPTLIACFAYVCAWYLACDSTCTMLERKNSCLVRSDATLETSADTCKALFLQDENALAA